MSQNIIHHLKKEKKKEKDVNCPGAYVKVSFLFPLKNTKFFLTCFQNIYMPGLTTLQNAWEILHKVLIITLDRCHYITIGE